MAISARFLSLSLSRSLLTTPLLSRSVSSTTTTTLLRLRPLVAVAPRFGALVPSIGGGRVASFSTRRTQSSLQDSNPNWTNRPPKETILLDGCDFEHWLVVMEKPDEKMTRDDICDWYVKTLAKVLDGSEEEARKKIYSVSTRCYFAFGALVEEELSYKLKELEGVRWVLPDSYLDVRNKDYGGEPWIDGRPVPYDPKYHEEWERNNAKAMERNRRNDRPRSGDRARNFERRRQNMQNPEFQRGPSPYQSLQHSVAPNTPPAAPYNAPNAPNSAPPQYNPANAPPQYNNPANAPPQYNNPANAPPQYNNPANAPPQFNPANAPPQFNPANAPNMGGIPPNNMNGAPNFGGHPQNHMHGMPQNNMGNAPNMAGPPNPGAAPYRGPMPPPSMGGGPNAGWQGNMPNNNANSVPNFQNNGGMQHHNPQMAHHGQAPNYQNNYAPNDMRGPPVGNTYNTRDMPPSPPSPPNSY